MRQLSSRILTAMVVVAGLAILPQTSVAASPSLDSRILGMIPPGAELVAGLTSGQQVSYLVMTVNNTTDLTDFQSITGADPLRVITRVVLATTSSPRGPQHEHSLLASGQFDFRHIVTSALGSSAGRGEYRGIPVLILQPLERNRAISQDVRWLTVIDSKILVFGSIPIVQQELDRYLDASLPDLVLTWRLSRLRREDQSWCVLESFVRRIEKVRLSLATLDRELTDPDRANDALVLGIHFGRNVEIEYENEPVSADPREVASRSDSADVLQSRPVYPFHEFRSARDPDYHILKVSRKEYDAWIEKQGPPGEAYPHDNLLVHKRQSRGEKSADPR
jgi:hypothetical protein